MRKNKIIIMKRIIAFFSVLFALAVIVPQNGWGADGCQPQACNPLEARLYVVSGATDTCFGCEYGDNDHECDTDAVAGHKNRDGYIISVFRCERNALFVPVWKDISASRLWCSSTDIKPANFADGATYKCSYSLDGTTTDYSNMVASLPNGDRSGTVCKICKCIAPNVPNADGTDCIPDPNRQGTCENAPSNGQWDSTNSKCLCGSNDRTDRNDRGEVKGEGQTYNQQDVSCKCETDGYQWDDIEGKCVDPNQALVEACTNSHGNWLNGTCVCDASKGLILSGNVCVCSDPNAVWYDSMGRCDASPQAVCEGTGGEWNATTEECNCDIPSKNIKDKDGANPARCECKNVDYEWIDEAPSARGCKLSDNARNRMDSYNQLKTDCENWGGNWFPAEYTADSDWRNWRCNCVGSGTTNATDVSCVCNELAGYELTTTQPPYRCELTDLETRKKNCEDTPNATWSDDDVVHDSRTGHCQCDNSNQIYVYASKRCIDNNAVATICALIPGARLSLNGTCLCEATHYPPVNGNCPSATSSPVSHGRGGRVPNTDLLNIKKEISDISKELKEISNKFGRSRWKTAHGNFNGARLASDSIAGVVLGTVGGVVTSNIIKKNQVKGGFEDINCAVGGQHVADYGDQFRVGIR